MLTEKFKPIVDINSVAIEMRDLSNGIVSLTVLVGINYLGLMISPRDGDAYLEFNLKRKEASLITINQVNEIADKNDGKYQGWEFHQPNIKENLPWYYSNKIYFG
ncbi:MAG: hypothetical protein ACD_12C00249G0002 [uncultured bacterium]|nr:MAG: hypothetical protein ACD_12C00249G0002 [uncultured bacterium]